MAHFQNTEYPVHVWYVTTCKTKPGPLVYHTLNNTNIIVLCTAHTGMCWEQTTTVTLYKLSIKYTLKKTLIIFIRFSLMISVTIYHCLYIQVSMMSTVKYILQLWVNMLSSLFPKKWNYRRTTPHVGRHLKTMKFPKKLPI